VITFKNFLSEEFRLTLRYHNRLNPKLWDAEQLKPEIAQPLLNAAYQFADSAGIPHGSIKDIIVTGGNANYNYTKFSDIDVHLICAETGKTADELYQSKVAWSESHADYRLAGYPVEFFAQPEDEIIKPGQGAWSLSSSRWVSVPKHLDDVSILKDATVIQKIKHHISIIRDLLQRGSEEQIEKYRTKIREGRAAGLEKGGEFSIENILYKELRNRGLLDRLKQRLVQLSK
jgi:hypothetical protein